MNSILSLIGLSEIQRVRRQARRGDPKIKYQLALLLIDRYGSGGLGEHESERKEIAELLEQAAGAGIIDAAYALGRRSGPATWLRHAARNGHLDAAIEYALGVTRQIGNQKAAQEDAEEAFQLALSAYDAGHRRGASVLQELYFQELGCTFDADRYFRCLKNAQYQNPVVQARTAWCHVFGIGTPVSIKLADEIFRAIHDSARFEARGGKDTEEPSLWLYTKSSVPIHQRESLPSVANIAKYMVRFMGGVSGFLSKLDKRDADALYLNYLAIELSQLPASEPAMTALLDQAAEMNFAPALFAKATTLARNDPARMRLLKKASRRGYLPAQVVVGEKATGKFEKAAWKTVIAAQEFYYKTRIDDPDDIPPLVPEMQDFTLRGMGFAGRESETIRLYHEDRVPKESMAEFFDVLLTIYTKYAKPFRPVSRKSMLSAIYNVVSYDASEAGGHPEHVRLPALD